VIHRADVWALVTGVGALEADDRLVAPERPYEPDDVFRLSHTVDPAAVGGPRDAG
jgi:hypothetical protein